MRAPSSYLTIEASIMSQTIMVQRWTLLFEHKYSDNLAQKKYDSQHGRTER